MCEPTCVWSNRASHGKQKIRKEQKTQLIPLSQSFPKAVQAKPNAPLLCSAFQRQPSLPGSRNTPTPSPLSSPSRIQKREPGEPFKLATGLLEFLTASASPLHQPVTPKAHPDACIPEQNKGGGEGKAHGLPQEGQLQHPPIFLSSAGICFVRNTPIPQTLLPSPTFLGCFTDA